MRRLTIGLAMVVLAVVPSNLLGQEGSPAGPEQALRDLVTAPTEGDHDRATVAEFLDRAQVREVAADQGIDVDALRGGVATLEDGAAAKLAERVRQADPDPMQVGGDRIIISSTVIIIVLLVVILLIVD